MISPDFACSFHGITIEVSGSRAVRSAMSDRFGEFPASGSAGPPLRFHFAEVLSLPGEQTPRPAGRGRPFYEHLGESTYYPAEDVLYLEYAGRAAALCSPAQGCCRISLLAPEQDQLWLGTHPIFTLAMIEMLKRRGKFNIHAAAFARNGGCILLPGTSGAGKSTLAIALLCAGFDFITDDMAFLEPGPPLQVLAFPENIGVTAKTLSFFDDLHAVVLASQPEGSPKYEVRSRELLSSGLAWRTHPKALVFPQVSGRPDSSLTPISSDESFKLLAPNVLLTERHATQTHLDALAVLARAVPSYRLSTGRDFDQTTALLGDLLG
jgi:hypothetical protein